MDDDDPMKRPLDDPLGTGRSRYKLRHLKCRRCARDCEVPGAVLCDECDADVPPERKEALQ